jgi:hypothetical protein
MATAGRAAAPEDINTTTVQPAPTGFIAQFGGQGPQGKACLEEVRDIYVNY